MQRLILIFALATALGSLGCVSDTKSPGKDGDAETPQDPDQGTSDGTVDVDGDGDVEGDGSVALDGSTDGNSDSGPVADVGIGPVEVTNCEQACQRYDSCGRLVESFDSQENCLRRCQRISMDGTPQGWFECLGQEQCNLLHLCPMPETQALSCEGVCTLADECGASLPFGDCAARCVEAGAEFQACGESLFGGACEVDTFRQCIVDELYPQCVSTCAKGIECNLVRPGECIDDCIGGLEAQDGLQALTARQLHQCVQRAGEDCRRLDACFNPQAQGMIQPDRAELCRLWDQCNLGLDFPCAEFAQEIPEAMVVCVIESLRNGCPAEVWDVLQMCEEGGVDPTTPTCVQLCEARHACDLIDADALRQCTGDCRFGGQGPQTDERERAVALNDCAFSRTCPDLLMCLENTGPAADCRAHCQRLAACGAEPQDCQAARDQSWARDRQAAHRECVAQAADDCAAVDACVIAPAPPCDLACNRIENECNNLGGEVQDCLAGCDDAGFARPAQILNDIACVLAAEVCQPDFNDPNAFDVSSVQGCLNGDMAPPRAVQCLAYCEATTRCAEAEAQFDGCLATCIDGFDGDDAIRFAASRDCLSAVQGSRCNDLTVCVPDDVQPPCGLLCDRAVACNIDMPDCAENCAQDPLGRVRSLALEVCLGEDEGCEPFQLCMGANAGAEPARVTREAFCAAWNACPELANDGGPCEQFLQFGGNGPGLLQCAFEAAQACEPFVFDELNMCFDVGGPAGSPIQGECEQLCDIRALCADPGFDRGQCARDCARQAVSGSSDDLICVQPYLNCMGAHSCAALNACLQNSAPAAICEAQCQRRIECGLLEAPVDCESACDNNFARAREVARRACLAEAADCAAVSACQPPPPLPCVDMCVAQDRCGLRPPGAGNDCIFECEDRGFSDPQETAQAIICIQRAADDCQSIFECQQNPQPQPDACLAYCRATTAECQENPSHDLGGCITECLTGFPNEHGLTFDAARECLGRLPVAAECVALGQCLPADPPAVDCASLCEQVDGCRAGGDDCAASCAAAPDRDAAGCVSETARIGGRCADVARCVGFVPPAAEAVSIALCGRMAGCDEQLDPFICRLDHTPAEPSDQYRLACLEISGCDQLALCGALEAVPAEDCAGLCEHGVACNQYPDLATCQAVCTGRDASPTTGADFIAEATARLDAARGEAGCDEPAAQLCLNVASCEQPNNLHFVGPAGGRVNFDNRNAPDNYASGLCGADEAPEEVVVLTLVDRARVRVETIQADYDTLIYVRSACDDVNAELDCNDDRGEDLLSRLDLLLDPGNYYIFVEGFAGGTGQGILEVEVNAQ